MFNLLCFVAVLGLVVASPTTRIDDIRIVGGEDIDITEAPYQVSLLFRGRHSCGGTLVANDIVITAAHCVMGSDPSNYQIRAGSSFSGRDGVIYPVGHILAHPDFSYTKMDSDIAIVWLSTPVTFSDRIASVEMSNFGEEVEDGAITQVTGWGNIRENGGMPSMLQRVEVPKVSSLVCSQAYSALYAITPRMLCAGAPEGGKDACQGDSGGPLIHNGKLAGVVSWGLGCARPDYPGVYTKVSELRSWIDEHILYLRLKNVMRWQI